MAEEKALLEIVPRERHDNSMLDDIILSARNPGAESYREQADLPRAPGDVVIAAIIPVRAPDGYTGDIDLIVGVNADGSVAGVRALSHKETRAGETKSISKSNWILGLTVIHWTILPGRLGGQERQGVFDQFTGATITPRAVVAATLRALQYAQANSKTLFAQPDENPGGRR